MLYSLRNKLILMFVLLLGISFFFMFLSSYNKASTIIRVDNVSAAQEKMEAYASLIDTITKQIYDFSSVIYNNDYTEQWNEVQSSPDIPYNQKMLSNLEFSKFITKIVNHYSVIATVSLYRDNGLYVGTDNHFEENRSFLDAPWYMNFHQQGINWVSAHEDPFETERLQQNPVISFLIPIGTFDFSSATTVMKVNVRVEQFMDPLKQIHLGEKGTIFLLNNDGQPLLTQNVSGLSQPVLQQLTSVSNNGLGVMYANLSQDRMIYVYKKLKFNNWLLVGTVLEQDLLIQLVKFKSDFLYITVAMLALSVIVAVWISYSFTKPLSRLTSAMRFVQNGEFSIAEQRIPAKISVRDEVGYVTATFRTMILKLRTHIENEFQWKLHRQQAEYRALLLQINPHFLFNTLELMSSLVMQRRTNDSVDVIESLGKMLRYSLNTSSDLVKLQDELKYTQHYISILQTRFSESLDISLRNEVKSEAVVIVKFLLQPLVENAVKFSSLHRALAEVQVVVWREEDRLHLQVADNGPGMDPVLVEQLYKEFRMSQFHQVLGMGGGQIGLRNILARCAIYYGDRFTFELDSKPCQGTSITLILPIQEGSCNV